MVYLTTRLGNQHEGEAAEQPSAESLRVFLDSLANLACYVDTQRLYRFNNQAHEAWFGRPRREITGRSVREIVGEDAYRILSSYIDRALAGERVTFSRWVPFDPLRPAFVRSTLVPDIDTGGAVRGFFALVEDLTDLLTAGTDLRLALDRLSSRVDEYVTGVAAPEARRMAPPATPRRRASDRASEEDTARQILETTPALLIASNATGDILLFNRACEDFSGYRREDVLGRSLLATLVPTSWRNAVAAHLTSPEASLLQPFAMPIETADRRQRSVIWRFSSLPIRGDLPGRVGVGFPTASEPGPVHQLMYRQDRRFGRLLRRYVVAEVTTALLHELSQPLSAVLGFTQGSLRLLEKSPSSQHRQEVIESLEKAAGQAHRLGEIVRVVRRQVRVDDRSRFRTLVDLNGVVGAAVERVRAEAAAAGIALMLDLEDRLPPVSCDPVAIEHVLLSVIGDCIDALDAGMDQPRWIRLVSVAASDAVEISITDCGPGIAGLVAGRLFDPFVGGKLTGFGLGLAICRTIVREHGGELWLDEQDSGSVFRLKLPCPME